MLLGVNIDHVATLRQARYATMVDSHNAEPSPLQAAIDAKAGGADSITLHVRADRRHMQDQDAVLIRKEVDLPLNLEMGNTDEMLGFALGLQPDFVCLVPESREEITTEGGLDVVQHFKALQETVKILQGAGAKVSLFIDPDLEQIQKGRELGAEMIELHTGCFANHLGSERRKEIERLKAASELGNELGFQVNAGHGINYENLSDLVEVKGLVELNIGHTIISRAMRIGLESAVREMKSAIAAQPFQSIL